jgi:hypothetical protein
MRSEKKIDHSIPQTKHTKKEQPRDIFFFVFFLFYTDYKGVGFDF